MKKNIFILNWVLTIFVLLSCVASADTTSDDTTGIAGAQVVYSGTILEEATCTITESPGSVNLGTWMTSAASGIGSGLYSSSTVQDYNFIATCDASVNVQFKITATTVQCFDIGNLCVEPVGPGQATGVGIAIFAGSPFTIDGESYTISPFYSEFVPYEGLSTDFHFPVTLSKGENTLSFSSAYRQTKDAITAGSANVAVTITFRFTQG